MKDQMKSLHESVKAVLTEGITPWTPKDVANKPTPQLRSEKRYYENILKSGYEPHSQFGVNDPGSDEPERSTPEERRSYRQKIGIIAAELKKRGISEAAEDVDINALADEAPEAPEVKEKPKYAAHVSKDGEETVALLSKDQLEELIHEHGAKSIVKLYELGKEAKVPKVEVEV